MIILTALYLLLNYIPIYIEYKVGMSGIVTGAVLLIIGLVLLIIKFIRMKANIPVNRKFHLVGTLCYWAGFLCFLVFGIMEYGNKDDFLLLEKADKEAKLSMIAVEPIIPDSIIDTLNSPANIFSEDILDNIEIDEESQTINFKGDIAAGYKDILQSTLDSLGERLEVSLTCLLSAFSLFFTSKIIRLAEFVIRRLKACSQEA